jgi:hypothetical protein
MIFADMGDGSYTPVEVKHTYLDAKESTPADRHSFIPPRPIAKVPSPTAFTATTAPLVGVQDTVKDVKWIVVGGVAFVGLVGLALLLK